MNFVSNYILPTHSLPKVYCPFESLKSDYLMPQKRDNKKRTSPDTFSKWVFDIWQEKAGINIRGQHSLRHAFAYRCLKSGMDIETLWLIMGHSEASQTLAYAKNKQLSKADVQEVSRSPQDICCIFAKTSKYA